MNKGRVTIPTNKGFEKETKEIMQRWGADAIRDCDGTVLPENIRQFRAKVYSTYFVIRGDNDWAKANPDEFQHLYLMSERVTAFSDTVEIELLKGYFTQQVALSYEKPHKYWQVIDRTTGDTINGWNVDEKRGVVIINGAKRMHEYTVSFLAISLWDPVQIYNYTTNKWDVEKHHMYDPMYPKTREYIIKHLNEWCKNNPDTDVIRFTTFLYQFSLVFNGNNKEKYVDWFGYSMSVSPLMLDAFEKEYGYALKADDITDNGYYNSTFRVPSKAFLDYMDFVQRKVTKIAAELVNITHSYGKEAMMFLGDCWIGAEPYGKYFKDIGLDAVVGSVGSGVTVRMLSDIPHVKYTEGRFLPYFFPDTFFDGNEKKAVAELNKNWMAARRAMMRKPLDRIGYGGYLSLAAKFPNFIGRVEEICNEFRMLYNNISGKKPYSKLHVAILNSWGKIRSWQCHMVAHELWYQQTYSYQGILEALSGLPVEVSFLSFDDIIINGVPKIDVIINAGDAYTAFSGGEYWKDSRLVTAIREYVYNGGGFIGVGEPSAIEYGGRYFQLADVLGVDKEIGFSLSTDKYNINKTDTHFITDDINYNIDYGEGMKNIYALDGAQVIDIEFCQRYKRNVNVGEVKLAVNYYGKGRGVYIAGLPYSEENSRLLMRAMAFASGKERELKRAHTDNILTECHYYQDSKMYAVVNNSNEFIKTIFYDINGNAADITLVPMEIKWIKE